MKAIFAAAACMAFVVPMAASEAKPFGSMSRYILCDMLGITGKFTSADARYVSNGQCVRLLAPDPANEGNRSEFPDVNKSREEYRLSFTAEGGFNPATKEAWETIVAPPPTVEERAPPNRPYGRFAAKMFCSADPWLDSQAKCTGISAVATGNLGADLEKRLRADRPFTSTMKPLQQEALRVAKRRFEERFATETTARPNASIQNALAQAPRIVDPKPGSTHRPQNPLKIRVAAPKVYEPVNFKVKTYWLEWQSKQSDGNWKLVTTELVRADELEGAGFYGWGAFRPGTSNQMMASVGTWRVRAKVNDPQPKQPELGIGEYVEYTIAGEPGHGSETVRAPAGSRYGAANAPVQGVAGAGAAPLQSMNKPEGPAIKQSSASQTVQNQQDAAALNPQPLPPKRPPTPVAVGNAPAKPPAAVRDWNQVPSTFGK